MRCCPGHPLLAGGLDARAFSVFDSLPSRLHGMSPSRVALTAHLSTGVERRESENILLDGRRQDMGFAGSIHDLLQTVSVVN